MTKALWQFNGMDYIKRKYVSSDMTDTEFAADMNKYIPYEGRPYTMAHVREWRRSLSIPNNAPDNSQKKMQEIADVADMIRSVLANIEADNVDEKLFGVNVDDFNAMKGGIKHILELCK